MEKIASHKGIVTAVTEGHVKIHIEVLSACATCESHSHCGFAEKSDKEIDIETAQWQDYRQGDSVAVEIQKSLGLKAVALAYVLPALLMLGLLVALLTIGLNEGLSALLALLLLTIYLFVLYKYRHLLHKKFSFQLKKIDR